MKRTNKISKWTNFESHPPKYREAPSYWKFKFCKVLYGKQPCPFNLSATQNLRKTTIFKLMVLYDTLVYDSDNWSTY